MSKSYGWGGGVVVAHKILETGQSPNSYFPFLFDFGLGLGTWNLDSGLPIVNCQFYCYFKSNFYIVTYILWILLVDLRLSCWLHKLLMVSTEALMMKLVLISLGELILTC